MSTVKHDPEQVDVDPWVKRVENARPIPAGARLACLYELHLGADSLPELLCLNRTKTHDELWSAYPETADPAGSLSEILPYSDVNGRVVRAPRSGSPREAALNLLEILVRSRVGYGWPVRWHRGGLVDEAGYSKLLEDLEKQLDDNAGRAAVCDAGVIAAARRLGLTPAPTGRSATAWQARCPGTHHYIFIDAGSDTFGCGYCRRKGGAEELAAFVAEREKFFAELEQKYRKP